jgi:hypothetical protein
MYVLKSKRWEIYANYSIHDREKCLDDAKALDASPRIEAVCVIRETFNAEDNTSREAVIYHSPTLKKPPPVAIVIRDSGNTVRPNSPASRITDTGRKTAKGEKPAVPKAKNDAGPAKIANRANRAGARKNRTWRKYCPAWPWYASSAWSVL